MSASERSPRSLKRDRDSFDDFYDLEKPFDVPPFIAERLQSEEPSSNSLPTPPVSVGATKRETSPARSSTGSLTDARSTTPSHRGQSPLPSNVSAFTALNGSGPSPPPKKVKLTFAEKEMKRINKEIRDQERATERARKEAARQLQQEERARRDAEKEAETRRKEAERSAQQEDRSRKEAEKEAEKRRKELEREEKKNAAEAEKAAKEEKKRKKEEERQRLEEEKRKKERSQKTLNSFLMIPAAPGRSTGRDRSSMSPAASAPTPLVNSVDSPAHYTPDKAKYVSEYYKLFPAFFIQNNVTMAPINRFQRDEEAFDSLQDTIDSYILNGRSPGKERHLDASSLFHMRGRESHPRGKRVRPVRDIMDEFSGHSSRPIDLTTDSQNSQIKQRGELLRKIPMKFLKFQEDVRPPYRGTYTSRPVNGMAKLARNPMRRDLPNTNYDYDSEAEWIEDEDAEDLNSEGEEDEDNAGDDVEDMEGFLDDENDDMANSKRLVLQGDLEPISTGLCWENRNKRNTNVKMVSYRMEIILDPKLKSIDPFSTQYWDPAPAPFPASGTMDPPRVPLNTMKVTNLNGPSAAKPLKQFFPTVTDLQKCSSTTSQSLLNLPSQAPSAVTEASTNPVAKPKKLLPQSDIESFKAAIQGSDLSKVGLIEVLKKKFPGRPAAAIKGTLEMIAKRVGSKEADKRWVLNEEAGLSSGA